MTSKESFAMWIESALAELDYALQHNNTGRVIGAFIDIGRAAAALGADSLVSSPEAAPQREALRLRVAGHDDILGRAAANLVVAIRRGYEEEVEAGDAVRDALFARSGYQVMLEMGLWREPPVSEFHLGEVDEELADEVARSAPMVPAGLPASHVWWWPKSG